MIRASWNALTPAASALLVNVERQFERTRDGAFAFIKWAQHLLLAYFTARGIEFGQPEVIDRNRADRG
jgi:hypothetical protein